MREYVTVDELLSRINERLHQAGDGDYVDCQFTEPVHRYAEPDETGCNWSDQLILRCSGGSAAQLAGELRPIRVWAHESYNLLSPDGAIEDLVFETDGHRFECRVRSEAVASITFEGPPARADNVGWWVRIDGGAWRRAFDASLDDRDPWDIRSRLIEWNRSVGGD